VEIVPARRRAKPGKFRQYFINSSPQKADKTRLTPEQRASKRRRREQAITPWMTLTDAERSSILARRAEWRRVGVEVLKFPESLMDLKYLFRYQGPTSGDDDDTAAD
jgi:hypothetical protein